MQQEGSATTRGWGKPRFRPSPGVHPQKRMRRSCAAQLQTKNADKKCRKLTTVHIESPHRRSGRARRKRRMNNKCDFPRTPIILFCLISAFLLFCFLRCLELLFSYLACFSSWLSLPGMVALSYAYEYLLRFFVPDTLAILRAAFIRFIC